MVNASLQDLFIWFMLCSFLGWLFEVGISIVRGEGFVNRGFLVGPYCPIYGSGALLFVLGLHQFDNPVLIFFAGAIGACILELITSFTLEKLFHARWWDYSDFPLNFKGVISVPSAICFGFFALIAMPFFDFYYDKIQLVPDQARIAVALILAVVFVIDIIITNKTMVRFNKFLREYQKTIDNTRLRAVEFIRRTRRTFEAKFGKFKISHILSWQQRRIIKAFPNLESTRYQDALERLRQLNLDTEKRIKKDQDYLRNKYKDKKS